jgi:hypothetical protein
LKVKPGCAGADAYDVTVDSMTGAAPDRCPRCAALVRPGSQWCTLCYADLRPAPPPQLALEPQPTSPPRSTGALTSSDIFDPLTAPLALLERGAEEPAPAQAPTADPATVNATTGNPAPKQAGWPCATCGATVPLDEPTCTSCGAGFLEGTLPVDPVLGRLSKGAGSNQAKVLIMVGGSLGLLVLILGAMYVLGAIF